MTTSQITISDEVLTAFEATLIADQQRYGVPGLAADNGGGGAQTLTMGQV